MMLTFLDVDLFYSFIVNCEAFRDWFSLFNNTKNTRLHRLQSYSIIAEEKLYKLYKIEICFCCIFDCLFWGIFCRFFKGGLIVFVLLEFLCSFVLGFLWGRGGGGGGVKLSNLTFIKNISYNLSVCLQSEDSVAIST